MFPHSLSFLRIPSLQACVVYYEKTCGSNAFMAFMFGWCFTVCCWTPELKGVHRRGSVAGIIGSGGMMMAVAPVAAGGKAAANGAGAVRTTLGARRDAKGFEVVLEGPP